MTEANTETELQWRLRVSRRARYARLRIQPFGGLEVVIPTRFPRHQVAGLVAEHADWARQQLARQARLRAEIRLPSTLSLAFDNSVIPIRYQNNGLPRQAELFPDNNDEYIEIRAEQQRQAIRQLRDWIRQRAQLLLSPLLEQISTRIGLDYNRLRIRSQKTRWGSCSSRGNISLNDQLLFLPRDTVEYLMVHELCHRRQLNHSRAFWKLVESHCPDYRAHDSLLGRSRNLVPDWFLLDLYS